MNWPAFANPWLLTGLAAVGLPVLIHFLTRARSRRVAFPPFRFLVEACAGQQAIHRLRTFVLLALRSLAVLALVLLFARPFLKPRVAAASGEARRRAVLLLDGSLSMRAVQGGVTLFDRAKAEAADVLRGLAVGDEAAVIVVGATPRPLLPALSANIPALHEALVKCEATWELGDFQAALALAGRLMGGGGTIYVFSDFQKSNWSSVGELPPGMSYRLRQVAARPVANVALAGAALVPEEPVAGENAEVLCAVFNCTSQPREETVHLQLGEFAQQRRLTIPPYSTANCAFTVTFPNEGVFTGSAWIEPDDLREDDTRYLAVNVRKAMQVALISDSDAADARSAAFFVAHALQPSTNSAPGLSLVRRHGQDVDRGVLETADVFLLVAPVALTGEAAETITRRVREGARFLAVLDGPTTPGLVPAAFNPPFRLSRPVTSDKGEVLVPGARALFPDTDAGDWSAVSFRRHYQNEVLAGRGNEVLLAFPDGSAAVTLSPVGKGAAVFLNLPLTPDGGEFVGSPLFPSSLHELLRALRRSADAPEVTPGAPWFLDVGTRGEGALTVLDPQGGRVESQVIASGRKTRLALPAAKVPGLYLVKQNGAVAGAAAVNVDHRESDTRPISPESLRVPAGSALTVVRDEEDLLLAGKARQLWPQLAAVVVACLAAEMLLLGCWRSAGGASRRSAPSAARAVAPPGGARK
jgi:hypothetical protein